ncbi:hypothetical protein PPYR_00739 [Photinus pyralis]|nr:hypothetical protein PPYR_00739 [Photinus pyralis]
MENISGDRWQQFEKIVFEKFLLSIQDADNCCALIDKSVVIIRNIIVSSKGKCIKLIGNKFLTYEDFYTSPCKSSKLNIYLASYLENELKSWDINEIAYKCMKLSYKTKFLFKVGVHCKRNI